MSKTIYLNKSKINAYILKYAGELISTTCWKKKQTKKKQKQKKNYMYMYLIPNPFPDIN